MEDPTRAVAPAIDVRQAFETWREAQGWSFTDPRTATAWHAWQAAFEAGRAKGLEEAAAACVDVEERQWYGYENPNTFDDGKWKCIHAIRSLAPDVPA